MNSTIKYAGLMILLILFIGTAHAALECEVKASCTGNEIGIISMSDLTNAHAGSAAEYSNVVCCEDTEGGTLYLETSNELFNEYVISLTGTTNAHAGREPLYSVDYYLKADDYEIDCKLETGSCSESRVCLFEMSNNVNAHVANCTDSYPYDLCCRLKDQGSIEINNLGVTGIEEANEDYTSTRNVVLALFFPAEAEYCRYINYDNPPDLPDINDEDWTDWETCINSRVWTLTAGAGIKTVFYRINLSTGSYYTHNDSIAYNYTGAGLDTTPPSAPTVYHVNYTNDFENISIYWYGSEDPESVVLGIPLRYHVQLFNESDVLLDEAITTSSKYDFVLPSNEWMQHGTYLYANVTVINSAGITASTISGDLYIDLIGSGMSTLDAYIYNISSSEYLDVPDEDSWIYSNKANLSWTAADALSGIYGYSYVLSRQNFVSPDNVLEGSSLYRLYNSLSSGKYYFAIKARDRAGNWGAVSSVNFSIDSTPPTTPEIIAETLGVANITYQWSASTDPESGLSHYQVNLTDADGVLNQSNTVSSSTTQTIFTGLDDETNYTAVVYAFNNVGAYSSSEGESLSVDTTPPQVVAMPNRTVLTNYPILKAWTNEQAVCYFNSSNSLAKFRYTNTTYHESKLNFTADGPYEFVVTCKDLANNQNSAATNFTVRSTIITFDITNLGTINTYENIKETLGFQVSNVDYNEVAGLTNDDITVNLDGNNYPATLFDIGNGYYNLSFDTPEFGQYELNIAFANGFDVDFTLNVERLGLYVVYEDSGISSSTQSHISYYEGNTLQGLATDYDEASLAGQTNKLNVSGVNTAHSVMITNTKKGQSLNGLNTRINRDDFLTAVNPSFGYPITENYFVTYKLAYEDYQLQGNNVFNKGKHNLQIINTRPDDQTIIKVQQKTNDNRVVLSG